MSETAAVRGPRPTVGHHFGSLLRCPQRAWLDYWGDPKEKLRPPLFLLKHQQDGLRHEAEMCEKLYPQAVRVAENVDPITRLKQTLHAIRNGAPAILQGYLRDGDDLGVVDVLERDDQSGQYVVGEFKRSTVVQTEHVLQVRWYTELLQRVAGSALRKGFFILGDGSRKNVDLDAVEPVFVSCKSRLSTLRSREAQPGPHLCRDCVTCPWRGTCVPQLANAQHPSLLPGVGRGHVYRLSQIGISRWPEVAAAGDDQLAAAGFESADVRRIRIAAENLKSGRPVTRVALRPALLAGVTAVALDHSDAPEADDDTGTLPEAVWYETETGVSKLAVNTLGLEGPTTDLKPILCRGTLAVYGYRDVSALARLCRTFNVEMPSCFDVLTLVESFVHMPLLGLELGQVVEHLGLEVSNSPEGRVYALRTLVDWLEPTQHVGAA